MMTRRNSTRSLIALCMSLAAAACSSPTQAIRAAQEVTLPAAVAPAADVARELDCLRLAPSARVGLVAANDIAEWSIELAQLCPAGLVFVTASNADDLGGLLAKLEAIEVTNVLPLLGTSSRTFLPEGRLDQIVLVSDLRDVSDRVAYLAQLGAALGLEGQLAVSDRLGLEDELRRAGFGRVEGATQGMQLWRPRNQW